MTEAEIRLDEARWWHKITVDKNELYVRNGGNWFALGKDMRPLLDCRLAKAERDALTAGAPAASGREFDLEAIGEMMDRILAGQRELTPAEQKNLRGIYDKLFRKVEAAAPRPEMAPALNFPWAIAEMGPITAGHLNGLQAEARQLYPLDSDKQRGWIAQRLNHTAFHAVRKAAAEREAPPDLAAALREALDRLEVDANRPTKNTELKTVRHGMKLAANRLRKALAQLKVQR